ncbi:MAG: YbhN family protein [Syntrophobacteraceae bacterium]
MQLLIRLAVSLLLLGLILSRVEFARLGELLPRLSPILVLAGFCLLLSDRIIMSHRWHILVIAKGLNIPFMAIVRMYFVSAFLGLFMPSSIAPDFIRVYLATKHRCPVPDALASVFLDRFIAFVTLASISFFSAIAALLFSDTIHISYGILLITFGPILASLLLILSLQYDMPFIPKLNPTNRIINKIIHILSDFRSSITTYRLQMESLIRVTLWSIVNHIVQILTTFTVAMALGIEISFLYLCIIVPLVSFLTMIPISLAGLGIQEGAFIYFFSQAGVSPQGAFALAVLIRVVMTLGCIPGGIFYLLGTDPVGPDEKSPEAKSH